MERILFFILVISFSLPANSQDFSLNVQSRNPKLHRFRTMKAAKKLVRTPFQSELPQDTLSTQELFPSMDPWECYSELRRNSDVTLRQSAHSWRYKNHKHRKSAIGYMKFRLVPNANRLTYPRTKKRQRIF